MSDNSLQLSDLSASDDDGQSCARHSVNSFKIPSNLRQIKLHLQQVIEKVEVMQIYAVYFETSFYLGQVQKIFFENEEEKTENMSDVEIKYLKWCGDDKFKWPVKDEVEIIKPMFIFCGPIETVSFDPFLVPSISEVRLIYNNMKKF